MLQAPELAIIAQRSPCFLFQGTQQHVVEGHSGLTLA